LKASRVKISDRGAARLRGGHLWVFDNEISAIDKGYTNGDIVYVVDSRGRFIGKGYINDRSKITVRILTFQDEEIDRVFFHRRIEKAFMYRLSLGWPEGGSFRVIYSEGDLLPGLVVDKYERILSLQCLTLGMERWKKDVVTILWELFGPETIVERSDVEVRRKEGLEPVQGILSGKGQERIVIMLDDLRFEIDLLQGHKTGFYLDQQENRRTIGPYVKGKRVLDAFSYTGAFALYAARYGAKEVLALEDSGKIVEMLRRNIQINNFEDRIKVERGDAFRWFRDAYERGERFDCIVLDPPSFVKEKGARGGAVRGYRDINRIALKLLDHEGILITSSCSQNISPAQFLEIIEDAATDAGCLVQLLDVRFQSRDHPILLAMPQTLYLKFVVVRKMPVHLPRA